MSEDNRKFNSWWQSEWFNSYIKILFFGLLLALAGVFETDIPGNIRLVFIVIGVFLVIGGYFAAKSRWNKI